MHHCTVPQYFCPVKSLSTMTRHLYSIAPEYEIHPIIYIDNTKHVITDDITLALHENLVLIGLLNSGYLLLPTSSYSL